MDDCTVIWLRDGEGKPSLKMFLMLRYICVTDTRFAHVTQLYPPKIS